MRIWFWLRKKAERNAIKCAITSISDTLNIIAKELEEIRAFQESLDITVSEIRNYLKASAENKKF